MRSFEDRAEETIDALCGGTGGRCSCAIPSDVITTAVQLLNEAIKEIDRLEEGIRETLDVPYHWCAESERPYDARMIHSLLMLLGASNEEAEEEVVIWEKDHGRIDLCKTCRGSREILYMYMRGPGDSPGNQIIPCPTCVDPKDVKPLEFTITTTTQEDDK